MSIALPLADRAGPMAHVFDPAADLLFSCGDPDAPRRLRGPFFATVARLQCSFARASPYSRNGPPAAGAERHPLPRRAAPLGTAGLTAFGFFAANSLMPRANSSRYLAKVQILGVVPASGALGNAVQLNPSIELEIRLTAPVFRRPASRFSVQPEQEIRMVSHLRPAVCEEHRLAIGRVDVRDAVAIPEDLCPGSRDRLRRQQERCQHLRHNAKTSTGLPHSCPTIGVTASTAPVVQNFTDPAVDAERSSLPASSRLRR